MIRQIILILMAVSALSILPFPVCGEETASSPVLGSVVAPFEATTLRGEPVKVGPDDGAKITVVFFIGTECPLVKLYAPRMQALADKYGKRGVRFLAINSNQQDSPSELQAFVREHKFEIPIIKDLSNQIADAFRAERTPEAFLLDADRKIVYHGRIDDQYTYGIQRPKVEREYLAAAMDDVLAGRAVSVPTAESVGCHIGRVLRPDESSDVTYSQQIARIMQKSCVECHRSGEIGPFPLTNYEEVVGWAEMIDEVVQAERMPPWHANPQHGKFANDVSLTDDEKQLIYRWVAAGAPRGNPADLPPPREFTTTWKIGTPDAVFAMSEQPFQVPAKGELGYQYFTVDPGFTEDKWIQSAECRPGNRSVVHHIIVGIIPPNGSRKSQGALHSEWLTATAPGARPLQLPEGYAKFVPAGSKLIFQMHYTPNGRSVSDRSVVGFKYADPQTVKKQVGTDKAANIAFVIPPRTEKHPVRAVKKFDEDTLLLAMFPHMHLRGCSFRYTLQLPNGKDEILLDVPHFDFNWQNSYVLPEPRLIPAGAKMICDATFDNSAGNLANPDPAASVRWGDQTWEEMMIGYFDMALAHQDLTQSQRSRTEQFVVQALVGNVKLPEKLKEQAAEALRSTQQFEAFALALRQPLPQLDRVCWTTTLNGQMTIEQVAQEAPSAKALPAAVLGKKVNTSVSKMSSYHKLKAPQVHADLARETAFDLHYMSRHFQSSVHIPVTLAGKSGTVNFWSTEQDAFPAEAVALLTEAAKLLSDAQHSR